MKRKLAAARYRASAFLRHDASGGILLVLAALIALLISNSPFSWMYDKLLHTPLSVRVGTFGLEKPLLLWINDGLMAVFFFLVGLEIKREVLDGELSSLQRAILPVIAAAGGMLVPSLIYALINSGDSQALKGWAIPAATDIAFAVGVLAILGPRVPTAIKVCLLALAIADDLGAIVIIALFYAHDLSPPALGFALVAATILVGLNRLQVRRLAPYVFVGVLMWASVLESGVHATLAGVVLALTIPFAGREDGNSPLERAENSLEPWVHFGIVPLFAFANAGVSLSGLGFDALLAPIPLGIAAGLFIGKQIGIFGSTWIAVRLGAGALPVGTTWSQIYGMSVLGGIGFTMSLFIGTLAFPDPSHALEVRIGVLAGSLLSAILGYVLLQRNPAGA